MRDWDTSSIDAMERTAIAQADGDCNLRIGEHWLRVQHIGTARKRSGKGRENAFQYHWGKNIVTRADAIEVHKMHTPKRRR
jgi:hypothetical protein